MTRYVTLATLFELNRKVVELQKRRIPQAFVAFSGLCAIGIGMLFLGLPDRMEAAPSVDYLTNAVPTQIWAAVFLLSGAVMCTLAVARYHWSAPISIAFSVTMFAFCAMSLIDFFEGPATGLVALLSFAYGGLNILSGAMAVAPINEAIYLRGIHHDHDQAAA